MAVVTDCCCSSRAGSGIIMFGWSTALLVTVVQHLRRGPLGSSHPVEHAHGASPR